MTDPTPHRATPEQWAQIKHFIKYCGYDSCLLELRDRLQAAEQRISELEGNRQASLDSSTPAGSLVEVVAIAIGEAGIPLDRWSEARAAILAVADWLDSRGVTTKVRAARLLREEVERNG